MAENFNTFFTSVAKNIVDEIVPSSSDNDNNYCLAPQTNSIFSFDDTPFLISDVYDAITSLEPKKTLILMNFPYSLSQNLKTKFLNLYITYLNYPFLQATFPTS